MFFMVTFIFFLVAYRNQDIELFFNIPMYFFPILVMATILIDSFFSIRRIISRYSYRTQLILGEGKNYGALGEEVLSQFAQTGGSLDSISSLLQRKESALISKLRSMNLYDKWQNNFYERHQSNIRKIGKKFTKENYQEISDLHLQKAEWRNYLKALIKNGESRNVNTKLPMILVLTGGIKIGLTRYLENFKCFYEYQRRILI